MSRHRNKHEHRVRTHSWEGGNLSIFDRWFDSLREAMIYALSPHGGGRHHQFVKIYDGDDYLVHHIGEVEYEYYCDGPRHHDH